MYKYTPPIRGGIKMKEFYRMEVRKGNNRSLKEYMVCNVILNNATGIFKGFANRITQVSFEPKIYVYGYFDQKMNRLTLLEVSKSKFKKPNLYIFKNIDNIGEFRSYSNEYKFMAPKKPGKALIVIEKIFLEKEEKEAEEEISEFLSNIDQEKHAIKIGEIDLEDLETYLEFHNFFF